MMTFATRSSVCRGALCVAFSFLLSACAGKASRPIASEPVLPPESFKVHPGLVGLPIPPELQPPVEEENVRSDAEQDEAAVLDDPAR
ncbi:MAG: hypothetical protein LBR88_11045 [Zoogloeaceae bacterium]|jgi:hypothetical protein|nr:hypothetical protein [Zoogloeaceae bacterium]